jgi:crossover junction endodeoxyribonuclease RuvC
MGGDKVKVIGIDPGSLHLGWGIIGIDFQGKVSQVEFGVLQAPAKLSFYERLHHMSQNLSQILQEHRPHAASIERIFLGKNVDSAFKLGHIRGMCAVECQSLGVKINEYAARTVKKQITGAGNSDKLTVQSFLSQQLGVNFAGHSFDASDALALAFCHVLHHDVQDKINRMEVR